MKFYSQCQQDVFLLDHFFRGKRNGVFVDIGAYDGEKFSNTAFFERSMGWTGLCVEPMPSAFAKLKASRRAICENVCVADFDGVAEFIEADDTLNETMLSGLSTYFDPRHVERLESANSRISRRVPVMKFNSLLAKHSLSHIDYCSIDTEGAELAILSDFDANRFDISVLTVEDNFNDERIPKLMAEKGYDSIARLEQDHVFKKRGVKQLPRASVFCAVWHGDPKREELLRGHAENLARQTVPVEPIYVFDGGDQPPPWLAGRVISVKEPLTIYQAWNVALSLVSTPFAMNLNLDDRLAPDAVAILEHELMRHRAMAAGGDWKVCYSQGETDAVEPCYPADRLPFIAHWPPARGSVTRLGSGTQERGTMGPATMWRMEAHVGAPRYPWRLLDGSLLRSGADLAWWHVLGSRSQQKLLNLPIIIGNYHSHPADQAEFRVPDERGLMSDPGVSML